LQSLIRLDKLVYFFRYFGYTLAILLALLGFIPKLPDCAFVSLPLVSYFPPSLLR
jgi:hypothetical protein